MSMQFSTGSSKDGMGGSNRLLHATRLPTTDAIAISKIYPTPPSVETSDKRYEEPELMEDSQPVSAWDGEVRTYNSCFLVVLQHLEYE